MSRLFYPSNLPQHKIPVSVIVPLCAGDTIKEFVAGMRNQTHKCFEMVVVGKSITAEYKDVLDGFSNDTGCRVMYIISDESFGKLLNRATVESSYSYLVFLKARYAPQPNFISSLMQNRLDRSCYKVAGDGMSVVSKLANSNTLKSLHLSKPVLRMAKKLCFERKLRWTWNGVGCWKSSLIAVNGFDENLKMGLIGDELRVRLNNIGVLGKRAFTYSYRCDSADKRREQRVISSDIENRIFISARKEKLNWSNRGLDSV